jgi:predicted peptidase
MLFAFVICIDKRGSMNHHSRQQICALESQAGKLNYLLYLPQAYQAEQANQAEAPGEGWPVVFFLHGSGERGDDPQLVKNYGLPNQIELGQDFPFLVVSPQCPAGNRWTEMLSLLDQLFEEITGQYRVDLSRIYLTGLSMGGQGCWFWALAHPLRFAALLPICGRSFPAQAALLRNVPIWVFHGAKDEVVPLVESQVMVKALEEAGNSVRFTIYPEAGHDAWSATYANRKVYDWLLRQHLTN